MTAAAASVHLRDDLAEESRGLDDVPALDFCLRVTQRRAREDLALSADGLDADRWLDLAQAFAGPPGPGRAPLIPPDGRGVLR